MCTIFTKQLIKYGVGQGHDPNLSTNVKHGYKVVEIYPKNKVNKVASAFFTNFKWKIGYNTARKSRTIRYVPARPEQCTFHCFRYKKDAVKLRSILRSTYKIKHSPVHTFKIIKVKLGKDIKFGIADMSNFREVNNSPQVCSNRVYWDGTFVR
jgi:hypothetical protein